MSHYQPFMSITFWNDKLGCNWVKWSMLLRLSAVFFYFVHFFTVKNFNTISLMLINIPTFSVNNINISKHFISVILLHVIILVPFLKNFYWSIVDLQCCVSFRCTAKWMSYTYTYTHFFCFWFFSHVGR